MGGEAIFDLDGKRVWVAGHRGMVGSALVRRLERENCTVLTAGRDVLDLKRQDQTETWLQAEKPDVAIIAAARVGGILANDREPANFLYDNLMIEANAIHGAYEAGVEKLLFLGSSCIYPKHAPQPMTEECLLEGQLEPTNQWYAIAKIAGIKLCASYRRQYDADFISAMPTNLYGPGDNFDLMSSHVAPALIAKMHQAKVDGAGQVEIWGSGTPKREFLHVDDLADACIHLLRTYSDEMHINVGSGEDLSIAELASMIQGIVGFDGELVYDSDRPDGTPRKLLDVSRLNATGWSPTIGLKEGLSAAYRWYRDDIAPRKA